MEGCPEDGNAVLTREQAKKQPCPLMPTTKIYEYHANGAGIAYEAIEYGKCTGEECPKWRERIRPRRRFCRNSRWHRASNRYSGRPCSVWSQSLPTNSGKR